MSQGGFIERCDSTVVRPRPAVSLPERGGFTFPLPYNTRGIRVTNTAKDVGSDCLWDVYSYWSRVNAHGCAPVLRVFLGLDRQRGGPGPSYYEVDKASGDVSGPFAIFPVEHALSWETGETWYWSRSNPDILYAMDYWHLYRVDVVRRIVQVVADASTMMPPRKLVCAQWHSSADELTHSCVVKDENWQLIGSALFREGLASPWQFHPKWGTYDECQIDKSGQWLLIKDNIDSRNGEDNLIHHIDPAGTRVVLDEDGAAGHSDNGFGYMVAADNHHTSGAYCLWAFDPAGPQRRLVYHTSSWNAETQHVSHCNAVNAPPEGQYVVGSGASKELAPRNNEVVGWRLDGGLTCVVIAPVWTDLSAPGGGNEYARRPKGNLDYSGDWFCWTTNLCGPNLDCLLVEVPRSLFDSPPPVPVCSHGCPLHCFPAVR
jgi:hypothetical protein